MEEWRDVAGFTGEYQVSSLGRVKSLARVKRYGQCKVDKILSTNRRDPKKYKTVTINQKMPSYVHRLVAIAFVPNPNNLPEVNHINGNKHDNRAENLEWCTSSMNKHHAFKTGLRKPTLGRANGKSSFFEDDILTMRSIFDSGAMNKAELARLYNVSFPTISTIINRRVWKHI